MSEILSLITEFLIAGNYQEMVEKTNAALAQGHSADEAVADPGYPRYAKGWPEMHEQNIRVMVAQQKPAGGTT